MSQLRQSQPLYSMACASKIGMKYQKSQHALKQSKEVLRMQMINQTKQGRSSMNRFEDEGNQIETYDTDSDLIRDKDKGVTHLLSYSTSMKMLNSNPVSRIRYNLGSSLAQTLKSKRLALYDSIVSSSGQLVKGSPFELSSQTQDNGNDALRLTQSERKFNQRGLGLSSSLFHSSTKANTRKDNNTDEEMHIKDFKTGNDELFNSQINPVESNNEFYLASRFTSTDYDLRNSEPILPSQSRFIKRPGLFCEDNEPRLSYLSKEGSSYCNGSSILKKTYSEEFAKQILLIQAYLRGFWTRLGINSMQSPNLKRFTPSLYQSDSKRELTKVTNTKSIKSTLFNKRYELISTQTQRNSYLRNQPNQQLPKTTNQTEFAISQSELVKAEASKGNSELPIDRNQMKEVMKNSNEMIGLKDHQLQLEDTVREKEKKANPTQEKLKIVSSLQTSFHILGSPLYSQKTIAMDSINSLLIPSSYLKAEKTSIDKGNQSSLSLSQIANAFTLYSFNFDIINSEDNDKPVITARPQLKTKKRILLQDKPQEEPTTQSSSPKLKSQPIKPNEVKKDPHEFMVASTHNISISNHKTLSIKAITQLECISIPSAYQFQQKGTAELIDNPYRQREFDMNQFSIEKIVLNPTKPTQPKGKHSYRWHKKRDQKFGFKRSTSTNPFQQSSLDETELEFLIESPQRISLSAMPKQRHFKVLPTKGIDIYIPFIKEKKELAIENIDLTLFKLKPSSKPKIKGKLIIQKQSGFKLNQHMQKQFNVFDLYEDRRLSLTLAKELRNSKESPCIIQKEQSFDIFNEASLLQAYQPSKFKSKSKETEKTTKEDSTLSSSFIIESNHIELSGLDTSLSRITKGISLLHIKLNTVESFCLPTQSNATLNNYRSICKSSQSSPNVLSFLQLPLNQAQSSKITFNKEQYGLVNPFSRDTVTKSEIDNLNLNEGNEDKQHFKSIDQHHWDFLSSANHFQIELEGDGNQCLIKEKEDEAVDALSITDFQLNSFGFQMKASKTYEEVKQKAINEYQSDMQLSITPQFEERFEIIKQSPFSGRELIRSIFPLKLKTIIIRTLHQYGYSHLIRRLKDNQMLSKKQTVVSIKKASDLKSLKLTFSQWRSKLIALRVIERIELIKEEAAKSIQPKVNYSFELIHQSKKLCLATEYNAAFQLVNRKKEGIFKSELEIGIEILPITKPMMILLQGIENAFTIKSKEKSVFINQCAIENRFTLDKSEEERKVVYSVKLKKNIEVLHKEKPEPIEKNQLITLEQSFSYDKVKSQNVIHSIVKENCLSVEGFISTSLTNAIKQYDCLRLSTTQFEVECALSSLVSLQNHKQLQMKLIDTIAKYKVQLSKLIHFFRWYHHPAKKASLNVKIARYNTITNRERDGEIAIDKAVNQMKKGISLTKIQSILYKRFVGLPFTKWRRNKGRTEKRKQTLRVSHNNGINRDINAQIKKMVRSNLSKQNYGVLSGGILSKCIIDLNNKSTLSSLLQCLNQWATMAKATQPVDLTAIRQYIIKIRVEKHLRIKTAFKLWKKVIPFESRLEVIQRRLRNQEWRFPLEHYFIRVKEKRGKALNDLLVKATEKMNRLINATYANWREIAHNRKTRELSLSKAIQSSSYLIRHSFNTWKNRIVETSLHLMLNLYERKLTKECEAQCNRKQDNLLLYFFIKWKNSIKPKSLNPMIYFSPGTNYNTVVFSLIEQDGSSNRSSPWKKNKKRFKIESKYTVVRKLTKKLIHNTHFYKLRKAFSKWKGGSSYFLKIKRRILFKTEQELPPFLARIQAILCKGIAFKYDPLKYSFTQWKSKAQAMETVVLHRTPLKKGDDSTDHWFKLLSVYKRIVHRRLLRKWKALAYRNN